MKKIFFPLFVLISIFSIAILSACNSAKMAQSAKNNQDSISSWWQQKQFIFHATSAQPMTGGNIQLTTDYTLELRNDSIIVWLPYFGRGFTAPTNPSEGGFKFATSKFQMQNESFKKKMYSLTIVPKDLPSFQNTKDVQKLYLTFGVDGYGTLQIQSLNQTPISFFGYVGAPTRK